MVLLIKLVTVLLPPRMGGIFLSGADVAQA